MKKFFLQSFFNFPVFFDSSFLSTDVTYSYLLDDFRKKFLFLYKSVYYITNSTDLLLRSYFVLDGTKYNKFLFLKSDINFVKNMFRNLSTFHISKNFEFKIPIKYIFYKMKFLGFVHVYKRRPVANLNYIFFEDFFIFIV